MFEIRDKSEDLVQFQKDGEGITYTGKILLVNWPNHCVPHQSLFAPGFLIEYVF